MTTPAWLKRILASAQEILYPKRTRTRYRIEYTGRTARNLEKGGLLTYEFVDPKNDAEVLYMFRTLLGHDHHKYLIYEEFSDGTERKIKVGRFHHINRH